VIDSLPRRSGWFFDWKMFFFWLALLAVTYHVGLEIWSDVCTCKTQELRWRGLTVLCETKRNETKWYFAKWYFATWYFAKWYFAKWYFAKWYFAKWYSEKWYFAKWYFAKWLIVRSIAKERNLICKLVANYKATLVSNRNGFFFVSRRSIFTLRTPRLVNTKGNLRFLVVVNFDLYEFWYLNLSNGHVF